MWNLTLGFQIAAESPKGDLLTTTPGSFGKTRLEQTRSIVYFELG